MWLTIIRASCIKWVMRTHSKIVQEVGVSKIREVLSGRGLVVSDPTVRSWTRRPDADGNIPSAYWSALADSRFTTLEELATHAETRARTAEAA